MKTSLHKITIIASISVLGLLPLAGCKKEGAKPQKTTPNHKNYNYQPGHIPGMGENDNDLTGSSFSLPNGIELIGPIFGVADSAGIHCHTVGSGGVVFLDVYLANHLSQQVTITLPAGLIFESVDSLHQSGLILQTIHFKLKPKDTCDVALYLFCTNEMKHASDTQSQYIFGPITDADPVLEIINLLKDKRINFEDYSGNSSSFYFGIYSLLLQFDVWAITDGEGLTSENIQAIKDIPDK